MKKKYKEYILTNYEWEIIKNLMIERETQLEISMLVKPSKYVKREYAIVRAFNSQTNIIEELSDKRERRLKRNDKSKQKAS